MSDPSPPADPLTVFSRALAGAQEIERRAQEQAAAVLDRAKLDLATLDEAARRLRLGYPELAAKLHALHEQAEQERQEPPRSGDLKADLEAARKRLAIYESFEDTIQSVLSAAMREAHEIRTRSEEEAAGEAERARAEIRETRETRETLERLKAERDQDQAERQRRDAGPPPAPPEPSETRGRIEEFPIRRPAAIERDDILADIERLRADRAEMIRERDFQADEVRRLRAERDAVAQQLAGLRDAFAATLQQLVHAVGAPGTAPTLAAPAPTAPAPAPAASITRIVAADAEVRVVVSPIPSFSALVGLEAQLQASPGIRSVYVRDLRSGTATLIVNVATAMPFQDLADGLARELGATIERVAEGIIELKLPATDEKAGSKIG